METVTDENCNEFLFFNTYQYLMNVLFCMNSECYIDVLHNKHQTELQRTLSGSAVNLTLQPLKSYASKHITDLNTFQTDVWNCCKSDG